MKNKPQILFLVLALLFLPLKSFGGFVMISDHYTLLPDSSQEKIDNLEVKASIDQDKSFTEYPSDPLFAVVTRLDKGMNWRLNLKNKIFREESLLPLSTSSFLNEKNLKKFKVSFKKIASHEKVSDWDCDHYALFVKNKKVVEFWATPFNTLGLSDTDLELLKDFYKKLLSEGMAPFLKSNSLYQEMTTEKMIIKSVADYKKGQSKEVMLIKQLSHQDFSQDLFEIPEGFRQAKN